MNQFGSVFGMLIATCLACTNCGDGSRVSVCCGSWLQDANALLVVGEGDRAVAHDKMDGFDVLRAPPSHGTANSVFCEGGTCWTAGGKGAVGIIEEIDALSASTTRTKEDTLRHGPAYSVIGGGDPGRLYVAHATGALSVVDMLDLREISTLPLSSSELYAVARDAASGSLFVGDERGTLFVVATDGAPALLRTIPGSGAIFALRALGEGRVVVGRSTGTIELVDSRDGSAEPIAQLASVAIMYCGLGSTRDSVVCGTSDGRIVSANLVDKALHEVARHSAKVVFVHSIDASGRGVSVAADGTIREWTQ